MARIRGQRVITVPVVGQLDRALLLPLGGHEDQRETPFFAIIAARFLEAEQRIKRHGRLEILHAHHSVQIFQMHLRYPFPVGRPDENKTAH